MYPQRVGRVNPPSSYPRPCLDDYEVVLGVELIWMDSSRRRTPSRYATVNFPLHFRTPLYKVGCW